MNGRPIIGSHYSGPQLDRALRRMPRYWVLEESRHNPLWLRFISCPDCLIGLLSAAILSWALYAAMG